MKLFWLTVPLLLLSLVWFYLSCIIRRGIHYFRKKISAKNEKVAAMAASVLVLLASFVIGGIWLMFLLHFAAVMLVLDLVRLIVGRFRKKGWPVLWERIYYSGAAAALAAVLILSYGFWNMTHVVKQEYTVEVDKSIRPEGYRIGLISDLHFGTSMHAKQLQSAAERIAQEKPDFVLLDGDIVDESTSLEEMREAFAILGDIPAPYGVYFVYGNHDRSLYSRNPHYTPKQLAAEIEKSGIISLEDSYAKIGGELLLIGRADRSGPRSSAAGLAARLDPEKVLVLADHQPCEYEEARAAGYDLILSGHTHGGQIWPGAAVAMLLSFDDMNYGYERFGGLQAIVTSGIAGWGFPVRTQRHSEFVMIKLEGAT
ncbi:MAG: metallophosphoesterase [Blautia sp.]